MDLGLPRETQQIDRVMEAFASRYSVCNPGIFTQSGTQLSIPLMSLLILNFLFRSSLCSRIQLNDASYRCVQQIQQK